jgi:hypothetical protein
LAESWKYIWYIPCEESQLINFNIKDIKMYYLISDTKLLTKKIKI